MFVKIPDASWQQTLYKSLFHAGQKHRGAAVRGDSLLWSPRRTQTQGLIQWPLLHTRHIHTFNRCGEDKHLILKFVATFFFFFKKVLLCRKHCCVLPPGWGLIQRKLLSLLVAILREWMKDSTSPLFSPWRGCLAQSSVLKRLVTSSGCLLNSLKLLRRLKQALMAPAGVQPDAAAPVGLWLPGDFVIRVPGGIRI